MTEMNLLKRILLRVAGRATLFRQNTGRAWVGNEVIRPTVPMKLSVFPGDVVIRSARPLHAGLVTGSSDLIGWTKVLVTPALVGRWLAVFTAIEVKAERGVVTTEQQNFVDQVSGAGGLAGIARSESDALALLATLQDCGQ